ncbi:hypothetical protein K474DRAFT_1711527 [Panus rudis PR-1116 ss-1]|nr:hypothetical protein K474DRAFT_1711527 [Panus rudis PR-1116 ss-1]
MSAHAVPHPPRARFPIHVANCVIDTPKPRKHSTKRKADVASDAHEWVGGIEKEIIEEMRSSVFGNTPNFLDTHFDISEAEVDAIYAQCVEEAAKPGSTLGYDPTTKRWRPFPKLKGAKEAQLYQPFCDAANLISRLAAKRQNRTTPRLHWRPVPHAAPRNSDTLAAKLKPDIIATLNGKCSSYFENSGESSEGTVAAPPPSNVEGGVEGCGAEAGGGHLAGNADNGNATNGEAASPDVQNHTQGDSCSAQARPTPKQPAPETAKANAWRFVAVPVEGKTAANATALGQILRYQRQVFLNEYSRRFTYSMVFANRFVTAYLTDRSGTMGSHRFNMHEEPKKFIRLIAGLEFKSPQDLGWDPTMKLVPESTNWSRLDEVVLKETYDVDPESPTDGAHHLVIQMPKPDAKKHASYDKNSEMESFVIDKPISLNRGRVIIGRATRIWSAWKVDDMHLPEGKREVYVVKDTWRDERRGTEGELYAQIHEARVSLGVAELHSYCVVKLRSGDEILEDSTKNIRRDLEVQGLPLCLDTKELRRAENRANVAEHSPKHDSHVTTQYTGHLDEIPEDDERFTRQPNDSNEREIALPPQNRVHSRLVLSTYGHPVKYFDSCLELVQAMKDAIEGHRDAYKAGVLHRDISVGNILIVDNRAKMRTKKVGALIDFDNGISLKPDRLPVHDDQLSGTMPFVSAELLLRRPYFTVQVETDDVDPWDDEQLIRDSLGQSEISTTVVLFHCWLHDLESFFWVLLWCCISRGGPGGMRRPELWSNTPADIQLRELFRRLFEHPTVDGMASFKRSLFVEEGFLRDSLRHTSTYCKILNPLLVAFHKILRSAFQKGVYTSDLVNTVHDEVVTAFAKAEVRLTALNNPSPLPSVPLDQSHASSKYVKREDTSPYAPTKPEHRLVVSNASIAHSQQASQDPTTPRTPHRGQASRVNAFPPLPSLMDYRSSPLVADVPANDHSDDDSDGPGEGQGKTNSPSPAERKGKEVIASKRQKRG